MRNISSMDLLSMLLDTGFRCSVFNLFLFSMGGSLHFIQLLLFGKLGHFKEFFWFKLSKIYQ